MVKEKYLNVNLHVTVGLVDLWGSQEHVRNKTAEYLNNLISLGVAG